MNKNQAQNATIMIADNPWYKNAIFYEVYVRAYMDSNADGHGDLLGFIEKLDYLKDLGIDCLWLLPIYPSPLCDDGYDISDYCNILPDYGSLKDFQVLLDAVHDRDMRVVTDLVLNHTSDQHPWFQSARADRNSPYRDYYVWSDNDQSFQQARIIFIDSEKSNWTWDDLAGQYYFHRFYASQPDLNFDNLQVQEEIIRIMRFWLDLGVDGFRVDAVPYLFEREGTNCENLPETHLYLKKLRKFIDENYAEKLLLCEANQWPEDVRTYFGDGDEFQMGFHFPIMPRIFKSIREGRADSIIEILNRTPPIPATCQWCTFLRNHDELTLEMVTEEDRQWMWEQYAPHPKMRLNLGIRRRLAPLLDNDKRKIALAFSILFSLPGSPVIYYGDEIGMGDNINLPDRNGLRTPMQWDHGINAGYSIASPDMLYSPVINGPIYGYQRVNVSDQRQDTTSIYNLLKLMIATRKKYPTMSVGDFSWLDAEINPAIMVFIRELPDGKMLFLHNLSSTPHAVVLDIGSGILLADVFSSEVKVNNPSGMMTFDLEPYAYRWYKFQK